MKNLLFLLFAVLFVLGTKGVARADEVIYAIPAPQSASPTIIVVPQPPAGWEVVLIEGRPYYRRCRQYYRPVVMFPSIVVETRRYEDDHHYRRYEHRRHHH